jgi:hypothetical protein
MDLLKLSELTDLSSGKSKLSYQVKMNFKENFTNERRRSIIDFGYSPARKGFK